MLLCAELGKCGGNPGGGGFWTQDDGVSLCSNSQDSISVARGPEVWIGAMEGSVLSPTSWERRRAWLRQSRHWQTQVLEEEAAAALQNVPDAEPSGLDDVFQEGKEAKQRGILSWDREYVADAQVCREGRGSPVSSLIAWLVKNLPAMQELPVRILGWEDPLEKGEATHSSILGLPLRLSW